FHLGTEGPLVAVATTEATAFEIRRNGFAVVRVSFGATVVVITPFLIPLGVGGEDTNSRTRPDAVASLPLLSKGDFVLVVLVASALGFDVVVAHFQQGTHDRRPLVHRTNTDRPPFGAVVVIPIDILVHTYVHHVPVVAQGDCTVVEDAQQKIGRAHV